MKFLIGDLIYMSVGLQRTLHIEISPTQDLSHYPIIDRLEFPVSIGVQRYQIHEFTKKIIFLVITRRLCFRIYS